jgi:hypothetical protein
VAAIVVASVMTRSLAWRAWAILAVWVVLADIVPVVLGRVGSFANYAPFFALDTRYAADAAAVAAICVALAFWPVPQPQMPDRARRRQREPFASQTWLVVGLGLTVVIVLGSFWSVHRYEKVTSVTDFVGRYYLTNAKASLATDLPRGTVIFNGYVPWYIMLEAFYDNDALESAALGPMASGVTARDVHWTLHPRGTIDNLGIFDRVGRLTRALVHGAASPKGGCRPIRKNQTVIKFTTLPPAGTGILRIGYWATTSAGTEQLVVRYGSVVQQLAIEAGFHSAYLPVTGVANKVSVTVPRPAGVCIGDAEAGNLEPSPYPLSTITHSR